ncbi:PLP-dependent transferase [Thozetella sp. PMI_491]|nr:PLP-dependent transferase [Thozetella sp. PMI_491]
MAAMWSDFMRVTTFPIWKPIFARKLFDIGWKAILYSIYVSVRPNRRGRGAAAVAQLEKIWAPSQTLVALSVRSALDTLLQACEFPEGAEVIVSAVTVPDMVRIILAHGLVPVALDLQDDASVSVEDVERLITPRTKLVLIAQLFGAVHSLDGIAELARKNDILLVEDCAQAFRGLGFVGSSSAVVSLFSFGPIKTCTSLGGALATVRSEKLLRQMKAVQSFYPRQTSKAFLQRTVKYSLFKLATDNPSLYGLVVLFLRRTGKDHNQTITRLSHSLAADEALLPQIRLRPSVALLETLAYQLLRFRPESIVKRAQRIASIAACCPPALRPIGFMMREDVPTHHYWICPVRVENPEDVLKSLLAAGFDAASGDASLTVVQSGSPEGHGSVTERATGAERATQLLKHIVYLPIDNDFDYLRRARLIAALTQGALGHVEEV